MLVLFSTDFSFDFTKVVLGNRFLVLRAVLRVIPSSKTLLFTKVHLVHFLITFSIKVNILQSDLNQVKNCLQSYANLTDTFLPMKSFNKSGILLASVCFIGICQLIWFYCGSVATKV